MNVKTYPILFEANYCAFHELADQVLKPQKMDRHFKILSSCTRHVLDFLIIFLYLYSRCLDNYHQVAPNYYTENNDIFLFKTYELLKMIEELSVEN